MRIATHACTAGPIIIDNCFFEFFIGFLVTADQKLPLFLDILYTIVTKIRES